MSTREELEAEREFLMKSLDDLDLERESGGIDDESYDALHDDYTARAAATIRALRDGVDARPARAKAPPAKRRVAVVSLIVVFAIVAGAALANAVGVRLPGQTSSGNTPTNAADAAAVGRRITALQKQVNASPNDYGLRLALADAYANNNDLPTAIKQWDAAITIDPNRPEGHAQLGRALYIVSEQLPDKNAQAQYVAQARAAFDKAIQVDPTYADTYFFRAVLLAAALGDFASAQADLQTYLSRSPSGTWRAQAVDLLAQVTKALASPSTTVPASP
ncbi:MAG: tetratricopeptide repeat protein [Acidimicrobiia bacterium]